MKVIFLALLMSLLSILGAKCSDLDWSLVICIATDHDKVSFPAGHRSCDITSTTLTQKLLDSNIVNNTLVYFAVSFMQLNESLKISDKRNISLRSDSNTIVECRPIPLATEHPGYGLRFDAVNGLFLQGLTINNCGSLHNSTSMNTTTSDPPQLFRSAIYNLNCTNINMEDIHVSNSIGTAMTLIDCTGRVKIIRSTFSNNSVSEEEIEIYSGGSGIYIEFTYCSPDWYNQCDATGDRHNSGSIYEIENCTFSRNKVSRLIPRSWLRSNNRKNDFRGLGKGGAGISVILKGDALRNVFKMDRLVFEQNQGSTSCYGGAMFIHYQDTTNANTINITHSLFDSNHAPIAGALDLGFYFSTSSTVVPTDNSIDIHDTHFVNNGATFGGSTVLFSSSAYHHYTNNTISFRRCMWIGNKATAGAAVMASYLEFLPNIKSIFPTLVFVDCQFRHNRVTSSLLETQADERALQVTVEGSGVIYFKLFTIQFEGNTLFIDNSGSCLYVLNGIVEVMGNSTINFTRNEGSYGGAIVLIGLSSILVGNDIVLTFKNNTAINDGGALYVFSIDKISSRYFGLCFVQYSSLLTDLTYTNGSNVTLIFSGNRAGRRGASLYISSFQPCNQLCRTNSVAQLTPEQTFDCIGRVIFEPLGSTFKDNVATEGTHFVSTKSTVDYYIPGKPFQLPAKTVDEIGHSLDVNLLKATLVNTTGTIRLESSYTYNYWLTIRGQPGDRAQLHIETVSFHNISFRIPIELSDCPAGYVLDDDTCKCSVLREQWNYEGIFACNNNEFYALARIGYWVGPIPFGSSDPNTLVTITCPLGYCDNMASLSDGGTSIQLPSYPSPEQLDIVLCRSRNRTGIVCGRCIEGFSVYFHSYNYRCGPNKYCHLGFLFYLLSEIIPLTIIFTITIVFRVNFTSGYLNGFVLFAQMLDSLSLSANGGVLIDKRSQQIGLEVLHIVYSPFNLDLFQIEPLSFCLVKGFGFLQIASIKYLTLSIALILVILLVLIMRCSCCYKIQLLCFKSKLTNSTSLINGLSAFLVLSYGLCCKSCYQILNMGWSKGIGNRVVHPPRVFRMGDIEYMSPEHIPYAILAMFFLIVLVVVPTLFLLLQPIVYRFLPEKALNWSRTRLVFVRIELFYPFLDTFQGCFKDEYRFFAGLYLMYRSVASGTFALINSRFEVYIVTEVMLILMLAIHAWVQPYRRPLHNHVDTAIFLIMTVINTLTIFRYHGAQVQTDSTLLKLVTDLQLCLVYLPAAGLMVSILIYLIWKYKETMKRRAKRSESRLPDLLISREIRTKRRSRGIHDNSNPARNSTQMRLKYESLNDFSTSTM